MEEIILKVGKHTGIAQVRWMEADEWTVAHYAALISVPFCSDKWEHLFVVDKEKLPEAIDKAKEILEIYLLRCTACE